VTLLESQQQLLCELVDAIRAAHPNNPRVRATTCGRSGARVFIHGRQMRELAGRRPHSDLEELRAQGFLRKVGTETGNVLYAVTAAAHAERDKYAARAQPAPAKQRPAEPAPEFAAAQTRLARLHHLADAARLALDALLDASTVERRFEPGSGVVTPYPWRWGVFERSERPLLGEAQERVQEWLISARRVFVTSGPEHVRDFDDAAATFAEALDRSSGGYGLSAGDLEGARRSVQQALDRQLALIDELPAAHRPALTMLVPDTNALIADPELERWVIPEPATIVVPAQVVSELDGKNQDPKIGKKASRLINRFKEYGRRGDTRRGVRLAGDRFFRELALDPDMTELPGLDPMHADDRILASALMLAQRELTSVVVVVTRDRNAFNKARQLELPAVDVADV
jgi:hypothetical protein